MIRIGTPKVYPYWKELIMNQFSQIYYPNLDPYEQQYNDIWFMRMLSRLTDDGVLFIPDLNKSFNKLGQEV